MAFTKAELEALKNNILASGQPITASLHRSFAQKLIDEMYDAQSRGDLLSGVQAEGAIEVGDTILVIRAGAAYLIPATAFAAGTFAGLGDVVITDPQDEDVAVFDSVSGKWKNIPLTGLFVTQAQLDAALAALLLPSGARVVSAELIITSDTAGTITAQWVDFTDETESVTDSALVFNTLPAQVLPAPGNFRFDIIQGLDDGTVEVKQGVEANAAGVAIPAADAGKLTLAVALWAEDGTVEVTQPGPGQSDFSVTRLGTLLAPDTVGKFAKVWEGTLLKNGSYALDLSYAEPKNATLFSGSGAQTLKLSFTCDAGRVIIADTVQITTGPGSTAGEFVLYQIAGSKAALYHKSNHYWGRIQYRIVFQNSQIKLSNFVNNGPYGAAPTPVATYPSTITAGGAFVASVTGENVDNIDPLNPVIGYAEAVLREDNTVLFDKDYIIGNAAARTGNVLFSFTGAKLGASTRMKHATASAFTFPAEALFMFDTADISTTVPNYFLMTLVDKTGGAEVVEVFHAIEGGI